MRRIVAAVILLLVGTLAASAAVQKFDDYELVAMGNATLRVVPYVSGFRCPLSIDNGCAGSIAGQLGSTAVLIPNARQPPANGNGVNAITGSTTDYSNQPGTRFTTENFAAVDYWVGSYTTTTALTDPLDPTFGVHALNPSCVYLATGGVGGNPQITCTTNSGNATIIGYDMTRGGTTCIALQQKGGSTGTWDVEDNNWKDNGSCTVFDTTRGNTAAMIDGGLANGTNIFKYNTLDANNQNFPFYWGSCLPNTSAGACKPTSMTLLVGDTFEEYNAFLNWTERALQYSMFLSTAGLHFNYNLFQGCCSDDGAAHGEFFLATAQSTAGTVTQLTSGETFKGNTILSTTAHHDVGDTAFAVTFAGTTFVPFTDMEDNFYVAGTSGGATQSAVVSGAASGQVFTTSAITSGTFGSGEELSCTTAAGNAVSFLPVYAGLTGSVSAGPAGGGNSGANQVSSWHMTLQGNATGQFQGTLDDGATAHATFTGTVAASSTALTVSGVTNTIHIGMRIFGTGLSTGETITAGAGSSWTVSVAAGAGGIGPEAMTGVVPGNTLTVTNSVVSLAPAGTLGSLDVGMGIAIDGNRDISAFGTGSGNAGTYTVTGSAGASIAASRFAAVPHNIFPGGWAANSCTATTETVKAYGFNIAWFDLVALMGQFTSSNNTMDLFAYIGSGQSVHTQNSAALRNFNGTITGNTLTVNSGTAPAINEAILPGSGVVAHTWVESGSSPTFTLSQTYGATVGPQAMVGSQTACDSPSILSGNHDISGGYTDIQMNTLILAPSGTGC